MTCTSLCTALITTRLQELNGQYRKAYPGLLYLTFVNGRSREAIADELEDFLATRKCTIYLQ
jgi:hypothetical protein